LGHRMITVGYRFYVSSDQCTLVQIFMDIHTGLIQSVEVSTRETPFDRWEPNTTLRESH
jgi:hypothetical protein